MIHRDVEVGDTYCEATDLHVCRVALTAITSQVALDQAVYLSGFSIITAAAIQVCVEGVVAPERTPDGRPGVLVQLCAPIALGIRKFKRAVADRLYILPHLPTCSLFDASPKVQESDTVDIGSRLSRWGDGFESKGTVRNREVVRIPVMTGEMIIERQLRVFRGLDAVFEVIRWATVSVLDLRSGRIGRAGAWEEAILIRAMEQGNAEVGP